MWPERGGGSYRCALDFDNSTAFQARAGRSMDLRVESRGLAYCTVARLMTSA
jgi:hypothetical protein